MEPRPCAKRRWEDIQFVQVGATGQQQPATTTASMPLYVTVAQAGSRSERELQVHARQT